MSEVSRIRIKYGAIEIEYEGKESFLRDELPSLIEAISKLSSPNLTPPAIETPQEQALPGGNGGAIEVQKLGISSIIARLKISTGPDLVVAAAAFLTFTEGKDIFSYQELRDTTKQATGHYNETFRSNFSSYVKSLVKSKKINDIGSQKYSLTASERDRLGSVIANA